MVPPQPIERHGMERPGSGEGTHRGGRHLLLRENRLRRGWARVPLVYTRRGGGQARSGAPPDSGNDGPRPNGSAASASDRLSPIVGVRISFLWPRPAFPMTSYSFVHGCMDSRSGGSSLHTALNKRCTPVCTTTERIMTCAVPSFAESTFCFQRHVHENCLHNSSNKNAIKPISKNMHLCNKT